MRFTIMTTTAQLEKKRKQELIELLQQTQKEITQQREERNVLTGLSIVLSSLLLLT